MIIILLLLFCVVSFTGGIVFVGMFFLFFNISSSNFVISSYFHSFLQFDLKDLENDKVKEVRFNMGDKVEKIVLDSVGYDFLYKEGQTCYFMHPEVCRMCFFNYVFDCSFLNFLCLFPQAVLCETKTKTSTFLVRTSDTCFFCFLFFMFEL